MMLNLGGKTFNLEGSPKLKLMVALEEKGIKMINRRADEELTIKETMVFIHQTLHSVDPEITEDWIQENVDVDNMKEVVEQCGSFFSQKGPST